MKQVGKSATIIWPTLCYSGIILFKILCMCVMSISKYNYLILKSDLQLQMQILSTCQTIILKIAMLTFVSITDMFGDCRFQKTKMKWWNVNLIDYWKQPVICLTNLTLTMQEVSLSPLDKLWNGL